MEREEERKTLMPIPPIEAHTRYFDAGPVSIGVEYRLLNAAIVKRHAAAEAVDRDVREDLDDRGVSLHVCARGANGEREERLRFDCFDEDPHYHYVNWETTTNDIHPLDCAANGDSLTWALERIRTRLPQMLARAGAAEAARRIDAAALEAVMPQVNEAARRAIDGRDEASTLRAALGAGPAA